MKAQANTLHDEYPTGVERILFAELRRNPQTQEARRCEIVLELLVAASTYLTEWRRDVKPDSIPNFLAAYSDTLAAERAYYETLQKLEEALGRYQWRSAIKGDINGFHEALEWGGGVAWGDPHWEHAIVRFLLDKSKITGELDKFRRCSDCRNWLYAATSHQRFCGETCRRRYTAGSPEFKEKRRNYMKQVYRPQQKQRDSLSLALAKSAVRSDKKGEK